MFNGIHHLGFITNDMNKTIRFYRDLLGFRHSDYSGAVAFSTAIHGTTPLPASASPGPASSPT